MQGCVKQGVLAVHGCVKQRVLAVQGCVKQRVLAVKGCVSYNIKRVYAKHSLDIFCLFIIFASTCLSITFAFTTMSFTFNITLSEQETDAIMQQASIAKITDQNFIQYCVCVKFSTFSNN